MPTTQFEVLEGRALFAITVQIDYSFDTGNFFDSQQRRDLLQLAADTVASGFADTLEAIVPGGGNSWTAFLTHPSTGGDLDLDDLAIPADTVIVYAGAMQMDSLGIAGPGGFDTTGSAAWDTLVATRGEANADGPNATDFGPYGGSVTFDSIPDGGWYFGTDPDQIGSRNDFLSVAIHEICHVLGFGTCEAWDSRVSAGRFTGPASVGEYDGSGNVSLDPERAHWDFDLEDDGKEVAMDPDIGGGERKTLTALDLAGLDDIGWEIPLSATLSTPNVAVKAGATGVRFTVKYSHYTNVSAATIGFGDVTVSGPGGFNATASPVGTTGSGKNLSAIYEFVPADGTVGSDDAGPYSISLVPGAVGDAFGNVTPGGSLGTVSLEVEAPPAVGFSADDIARVGGAVHEVRVTYSDPAGIDEASIGIADVSVGRDGDGLPVSVNSFSMQVVDAATRIVTYVLAAPGGSWDTSDNGTYVVTLNAGQVGDNQGATSEGGVIGTFAVDINAIAFGAGNDLVYKDFDGDFVTLSMKGPGGGRAFFDAGNGAGDADVSLIELSNTAVSTTFTIAVIQGLTGSGGTPIGGLTVNGSLKSFTAKAADLAGDMAVSGTLPRIQFRNASGSMTFGPGGSPMTLMLARGVDLSVTSQTPFRSIKANAWLDSGPIDVIAAPSLTSLAVKGNFEAGIDVGSVGKVTIGGALAGAEIRARTLIGTITVGSATDSVVAVGAQGDLSLVLPSDRQVFTNPSASLGSFSVKSRAAGAFSGSAVVVPVAGKLSLGRVDAGEGQTGFGVAAMSIRTVTGSFGGSAVKGSRLDDPSESIERGPFAVRIL